jgi:hypothetical protein
MCLNISSVYYLMKHAIALWCTPMFITGFLRNWRGEHQAPHDLFTYKFITSTCNGIWYASPYGVFPLVRFANRIQIHMTNRDPLQYKSNYDEGTTYNYNAIW